MRAEREDGSVSVPEEKPMATKKKVLVDCRVVAEFHRYGNSWRTPEQNAKEAETRCEEFNEFIRDHRSQDDIRLDVERITEEQCSVCGGKWETDHYDGALRCANCGVEVDA